MLQVIFWTSAALIAYTYFGFPLLLFVRSRWFRRPPHRADITPHLTLLIVAHNEAAVIGSRLDNVLSMDYPRDRLTVLVASDGSDDGTNEIVNRYAHHGIRLLAFPRRGKIVTLNAAVAYAQGDILVFSDANSMCAPDAFRTLVKPFADPNVGGVAGHQIYTPANNTGSADFGERAYWNLDQALWEWQSAAGSVTQATGALYAIRRELFSPVPAGLGDDALISFHIIARGYRLVFEPRAVAMESVASSSKAMFRRRVRLCAMGFLSVFAVRGLLNPWRYGFYALQLFSHKVLRWMMPWPLLALLISSLFLVSSAKFYAASFALQVCFYVLALIVALLPEFTVQRLSLPKALTLPFSFCLAYAASLQAQWITLHGHRWDRGWTAKGAVASATLHTQLHSKVAYIMSRFPKITETFVLYEILEHQRRGDPVEIYPLMRERQTVAHPDAAPLVESAHFMPFFSPAILSANWYYLRRSPRQYLGVILEALRGTFGSPRFFLGALIFLPKSAAFAREMERTGITHVHAHFATHAALSALIVHRLTGIPFSFTAHAHDVQCDLRMMSQKLEAASFAVAISNCNRDLMVEECGEHVRDKIHVIHCGADTEFFTPPLVAPPLEPLRLICVASLNEMKGHRDLVQACSLLRQRGIAFHCDLIGDGELREQIESQIAAAGLQDAFTFYGPQPRETVRRMVQQAHAKVLASFADRNGQRDGIPVALMEAMACGLPVVSTRISGIPELVHSGISGILVEPRDTVALADALEHMARNPELRGRMGQAGREWVLREFDLAANAEALGRLFARPSARDPLEATQAA